MNKFNEAHKQALDTLLLAIPGVSAGKMFGYPAYTVNGKAFAVLCGEGVALKLGSAGAARVVAAATAQTKFFEPADGLVWKAWAHLRPADPADYPQHETLFHQAMETAGGG